MHRNDLYDSGSQVKCKNALGQSDCRIFELYYLKNYLRYKVNLFHAGTYLLRLQVDDVILGGCGQACPRRPLKALRSQKLKKV